jgi:hypothetical protein
MNVLVIPEDFRKDQYMLKPMVEAMLTHLGYSRARVRVLTDPLLGGISQALNHERIREIVDRYRGMTDLFLLCVDRDGNVGRRMALDHVEAFAASLLPADRFFLAENAWQELEVWVLAGLLDLPKDWNWKEIRAEMHPKERFFEPVARERGVHEEPGGGRKTLATEAARRYSRIRQLCPEDVRNLENRIGGLRLQA